MPGEGTARPTRRARAAASSRARPISQRLDGMAAVRPSRAVSDDPRARAGSRRATTIPVARVRCRHRPYLPAGPPLVALTPSAVDAGPRAGSVEWLAPAESLRATFRPLLVSALGSGVRLRFEAVCTYRR